MRRPRRELTLKDLLEPINFDDVERFVEKQKKLKALRRERPWVRDIISVLWARSLVSMDQLTRQLWAMRNPSGLPMPDQFQKTIQSVLNQHTSQSTQFSGKRDDDLFHSPEGKFSGTWAVHRDRAAAWLAQRRLPPL
jgi:hypothetical protein